MSRRVLRPRADICQLCNFMRARQSPLIHQRRTGKIFNTTHCFSTTRRTHAQKSPIPNSPAQAALNALPRREGISKIHHIPRQVSQAELEQRLREVRAICDALLSLKKVPSEGETLLALLHCNSLAEILVIDPPSLSFDSKDDAASALLSLDHTSNTKKISPHRLPPSTRRMVDELSTIAFSVVKYPPVFITPEILKIYTCVQSNLGKPGTFPEVFYMYANKPVPQESSPIRYTNQNPNKVSNAIPVSIANRALQTAIDAKQLVVAIDIIESTYTTKAFRRSKFLRKCLLPVTGLAVAPVAAYTVASRLAVLQTTMDSGMATNVAFTGILAYIGFTATIGVVAVTTANDQMDRVTWAQGIPLRERWIREDERAAIDKVAGSWGFREIWRRGEEEGEDWDALREWIGGKGMMLDRVELMEGME